MTSSTPDQLRSEVGYDASDVSVVICAYHEDRWRDLVSAIESVRSQEAPAGEVVVVIDHNPSLLDRVRQRFPGIVAVPNAEGPGLSGARNSGIASSTGAIVAFLDDDAIAAPSWLGNLVAAYDSPRVLGVGGSIAPVWVGGRPNWFPPEFDWVVGCTYRGMPETGADVRNLIGANMSIRREVFAAVGGFRTEIGRVGAIPVGCEETELCIRGSQHWPDRSWRYEPGARVFHKVPSRRARWAYFQSRCYAEGHSKATVSGLVGTSDGLSSERSYTFRTLPVGVVRGIGGALLGRDEAGLRQAAAIVAGLGVTTIGYGMGRVAAIRRDMWPPRHAATRPPAGAPVLRPNGAGVGLPTDSANRPVAP